MLQVHSAVLAGSRKEVVIKVLRPGTEDVLLTDLNFVSGWVCVWGGGAGGGGHSCFVMQEAACWAAGDEDS
jgi:hypothetical protein